MHWARRVAGRFPDGQLYVNLRGFDRSGSTVDPADAMRGFLDALDVPPQRVPEGLEAQVALYRSLLADRRMLIVLDNARDAQHVRPLLPGAPGCLVVVTSRDRLVGLVSAEGAVPLTLGLLTDDGSRELLARRIGWDRLAAEPAAVDQIVSRCVGLPLALSIVAARAATYPQFRLQVLADELGDSRDRLDALAAGDAATEVRAVFSWSYRTVPPAAARLFRLLGLHTGADISAAAAASLAGVAPRQARSLLDELSRANLIVEHAPARYTFHDLLRAYAVELAHRTDGAPQRRAAVDRVLDHYVYTGHAAALLLNPRRDPTLFRPLRAGVTPEPLGDHAAALAWFTAEHHTLLATVDEAGSSGRDDLAWQLAWILTTYLNRRGHWHEWAGTWQTALAAAHRLADEFAEAAAHRGTAWAYLQLGRLDDAFAELRDALHLYDKMGHLVGQADTYLDLGRASGLQGGDADAMHHAQQALELYRAAGHRAGQALALNNVGMSQTELGHHREALDSCEQALALQQEYGNADGVAGAWDSLGSVHHHLGDHAGALDCYRSALDLYVDLGDRFEEAATLSNIGDVHDAVGDRDAARVTWRRALRIQEELAHPDADRLRAKLRSQ